MRLKPFTGSQGPRAPSVSDVTALGMPSAPSERESFWSQSAAASEVHQQLLRRDRARSALTARAKAATVQKALQDLETLFAAMGRQYDDLEDGAQHDARTGLMKTQ